MPDIQMNIAIRDSPDQGCPVNQVNLRRVLIILREFAHANVLLVLRLIERKVRVTRDNLDKHRRRRAYSLLG